MKGVAESNVVCVVSFRGNCQNCVPLDDDDYTRKGAGAFKGDENHAALHT